MLAFNLGIFFRNLAGQRVRFDAENTREQVHFTGSVSELEETKALIRELRVTLTRGDVALRIVFEDSEDPEEADQPEVELTLVLRDGEETLELLSTTFAFDEIRFHPEEPDAPNPDEAPKTAPPTPQAR